MKWGVSFKIKSKRTIGWVSSKWDRKPFNSRPACGVWEREKQYLKFTAAKRRTLKTEGKRMWGSQSWVTDMQREQWEKAEDELEAVHWLDGTGKTLNGTQQKGEQDELAIPVNPCLTDWIIQMRANVLNRADPERAKNALSSKRDKFHESQRCSEYQVIKIQVTLTRIIKIFYSILF